jgi:hypothetical protein
MGTLYVSDLDGTLLRDDETLSQYTCDTINRLVANGLKFSFATARSQGTALNVVKGLQCEIPMVVHNGSMVVDSLTSEVLISNFFESYQVFDIKSTLDKCKISPIVYSFDLNKEKFSYVPTLISEDMKAFLKTRKGDVREHPTIEENLYSGGVFYVTCIDTPEKLKPAYEALKSRYECIYQKDYYSKCQWLEILPKGIDKAHAVLQLKELLHCDKLVCFGDNVNDIPMFKISDECYAVSNAIDELKSVATGVIDSNLEDGVAKWLESNGV